ncbi:MAG TPA: hypothetical protein VIJ12_07210 [Candidatus Baltobacteraceae bacterium]
MLNALGRVVAAVLLIVVAFHALRASMIFAGFVLLVAAILIASAFAKLRAPQPLPAPKDR